MEENYNQETEENPEEEGNQIGLEIATWETPEYHRHDRPTWWYIVYALAAIGLIVYALATNNFLFAVILIIGSFSIIINDARTPQQILISLTTEGIIVGNRFYDYDEIKNFAIVYKPNRNLKQLYFDFKSISKQRLSISIHDTNPLFLRENLMKYLPEDLERTDESTSEILSRFLKL
jgi:hypothetical protein